jgi:hypothetical protein
MGRVPGVGIEEWILQVLRSLDFSWLTEEPRREVEASGVRFSLKDFRSTFAQVAKDHGRRQCESLLRFAPRSLVMFHLDGYVWFDASYCG